MKKLFLLVFCCLSIYSYSQIRISLPYNYGGNPNSEIEIPVFIDNLTSKNVYSFDVKINFDDRVLKALGVTNTGTISSGMMIQSNNLNSGEILISAAIGSPPLSNFGVLFNVKFQVVGNPGSTSYLNFSKLQLNSGVPAVDFYNGSLTVSTNAILWAIPFYPDGLMNGNIAFRNSEYQINVMNIGSGSMSWISEILDNPSYARIISGNEGIDQGIVKLSIDDNNSLYPRTISVKISSNNANGSPRIVNIIQDGSRPYPPIILQPNDKSGNIPVRPLFSWMKSLFTNYYTLEISPNKNVWTNVIRKTNVTDTVLVLDSNLINFSDYYWRVNATNNSGTSDWSQVFSFKTIISKPAAPNLIQPADNKTAVIRSPVFSWSAVNSAKSYKIQVSANKNNWGNPIFEKDQLSETYITLPIVLLGNKLFYWRVNALNDAGESDWSGIFTLKTIITPPILASPLNNSTDVPNDPVLTWYPDENAISYKVQLSDSINFNSTFLISNIQSGASFKISNSLEGVSTFYWRVSASSSEGTSDWSEVFKFTTKLAVPRIPQNQAPLNNSNCISTLPTFFWNKVVGTSFYDLQLSTDQNNWSNPVFEVKDIFDILLKSPITLINNQTYYWRVHAKNDLGSSDWSAISKFTTFENKKTNLLAPINRSLGLGLYPILKWNSTNSSIYYYQVSPSSSDWTNLILNSQTKDTFAVLPKIDNGKIFYWRVKSSNAVCSSDWSEIFNFKTIIGTPILKNPLSGSFNEPTDLTLYWENVAGANFYNVQISTDSLFNTIQKSGNNITDNQFDVKSLDRNTGYFWRVNAQDSTSTSNWSEVWKFSTLENPPLGTTLISPNNNSAGISLKPIFKWNSNSAARKYKLQISTNSDFSSMIVNDSLIISTTYILNTVLSYKSTYFWRVSAINYGGNGPWSETWSFTIVGVPVKIVKISVDSIHDMVNSNLKDPFSIRVLDDQNYPVPDLLVNFSITKTPSGAMNQNLSMKNVFTDIKGEASTSLKLGSRLGLYEVTAIANSLENDPIIFSAFATSAIPEKISLISGNDQIGEINTTFVEPFVIQITDNDNNPVENTNVKFILTEFPEGALGQSLSIYETITDYEGKAKSILTLGDVPGTYKVMVVEQHLIENPITFTSTAKIPDYPSSFNLSTIIKFPTYSKPSDYKPTDWKLVGLPGAKTKTLSEFFTGTIGSDYEIIGDNGKQNDFMVYYSNSHNFFDTVGRGFWLIKKGDWKINMTFPTYPLNANNEIEISLHPNWNIITNPYHKPIVWSRIQTYNQTTSPIFAFNGSWTNSDTLQIFSGYAFNNKDNLSKLKLPYYLLFKSATNSIYNDGIEWRVDIILKSKNLIDNTCWFGIVKNNYLPYEFEKPRGISYFDDIFFKENQNNLVSKTFLKNEHIELDLQINSSFSDEKEIVFRNLRSIPEDLKAVLIDQNFNILLDLKKDSILKINGFNNNSFKIIVDKNIDFLKKVPEEINLLPNFPNPFNNSTRIPVNLPVSSLIKLQIIDVLGREIITIYEGNSESGEKIFEWNGKDISGKSVPSGIYYCKLSLPNKLIFSNKMLLMK